MRRPDFEMIIRDALKDKFGYVDPRLGRSVLKIANAAYDAGLVRAAEIAAGFYDDSGDNIAAAIRAEKDAP